MARDAENVCAGSSAPGVRVETRARLHLGFLDLNGELGRRFGSLGLAIGTPAGSLTLRRASKTLAHGADADRAARYLQALRTRLAIADEHEIAIEEAIPSHAGLGSGTQLALAVAAAIRRLHGLAAPGSEDATWLDRGARSGVGIGLFEAGGIVVDGGRSSTTAAPPLLARVAFPEAWRVILVLDPARQGIHGERERAAFRSLGPMEARDSAEICRHVLMGALPSVHEGDIVGFGAAITHVQRILGDYFAPAQGGLRFASPEVAATLELLAREGAHGLGQSSWGPTGFAFAESASSAERLAALARGAPNARSLDIRVVAGINRGARIAGPETFAVGSQPDRSGAGGRR